MRTDGVHPHSISVLDSFAQRQFIFYIANIRKNQKLLYDKEKNVITFVNAPLRGIYENMKNIERQKAVRS